MLETPRIKTIPILIGMMLAAGFLVLVYWLSRGEWIYPTQPHATATLTLNGDSVGQTFVAEQAGLEAIRVKMPALNAAQTVAFSLRESPSSTEVLRQSTVTIPASSDDQWVLFSFEPLSNSRTQYYYVSIAPAENACTVAIYYGFPETYQDGSLYVANNPQSGQTTFNLVYNRPAMLWDLVGGVGASVPNGVMILLAFFVPGWALLALFQHQNRMSLHWVEGIAVAVGLSLALYPMLFLLTDAVGVHLGRFYLWGTVIAAIAVLLWHYRVWKLRGREIFATAGVWAQSETFWADVTLAIVAIIALTGRLLMVRGLDLPLLGDSVHHTTLTQLIMDNGGLFHSWEPYAPYETFSFHFGFHVNSAIFGWATGLSAPQAVLWGGQFFNFLAVLLLYPLAYRLKGAWAGVIAVFVAGVFTQFPVYYVNWGRYPQLMGQAVLMIAAWWTWVTLTDDKLALKKWLWLIFGALLISGTALGYYRMAFHYVAFVFAALLVVVRTVDDLRRWQRWAALGSVAVLTLLLMSSWLKNVAARFLFPTVPSTVQSTVQPQTVSGWTQLTQLAVHLPMTQMLIVLMGILGIVWWGKRAALPVVWLGMLLILPVLKALSIPGAGIIQQFTIETSLYMPLALILGVVGAFFVAGTIRSKWGRAGVFSIALMLVAIVRLPALVQTLDRGYSFVGKPDIIAADWIDDHLPQNSFFLINGIVYTDGVSSIGGDAGWWLPILTHRGASIPPQYALLVEKPSIPGYSQAVNNLVQKLSTVPVTGRDGKTAICNFPIPITHVYLGQNRGRGDKAGTPPPRPMLPADDLLRDAAFQLIYRQDRVMIFKFDRSVCAELN